MTLPNVLTICRFLLIPVYIVIFAYDHLIWAFFVLVLAGLTDVLDGYIARKTGQVTFVGSMLDPLADKLMMLAVIISLLYSGLIPWQAAVAMFVRDIGMIIGSAFFHFRGKKTVPANIMGKLTTVLYYFSILFIVFKVDFAITYLWLVILFSFVTSIIYIFQFKSLNSESSE